MINLISRLLCKLGYHGPVVLGYRSCYRSSRPEAFVRKCEVCGATWHGDEVQTPYTRTLGAWRRVK